MSNEKSRFWKSVSRIILPSLNGKKILLLKTIVNCIFYRQNIEYKSNYDNTHWNKISYFLFLLVIFFPSSVDFYDCSLKWDFPSIFFLLFLEVLDSIFFGNDKMIRGLKEENLGNHTFGSHDGFDPVSDFLQLKKC